jgi:hypothetical protein
MIVLKECEYVEEQKVSYILILIGSNGMERGIGIDIGIPIVV